MPLLFLLLFVVLPLLELYLLIQVGARIGALPTLLLTVLTAALGVWLVRRQGFGILMRIRALAERGEPLGLELLDGGLLLLAGLGLLLPGLLTDTLGLLLLIPPLRRWLIVRVLRALPVMTPEAGQRTRALIIDADYRRED